MTSSKHSVFDSPKKSAYSFERCDSSWERQYMDGLEADAEVDAWTKNHKIRIPYIDTQRRKREYRPDFLLRKTTGELELHEVKGGHLLDSENTKLKLAAGKSWCAERGIEFVLATKE